MFASCEAAPVSLLSATSLLTRRRLKKVFSLRYQQMITDQDGSISRTCERHQTQTGSGRKKGFVYHVLAAPRSSCLALKTEFSPDNTSPDRWSSLSLASSGGRSSECPSLDLISLLF